jgi:hypothetical protein
MTTTHAGDNPLPTATTHDTSAANRVTPRALMPGTVLPELKPVHEVTTAQDLDEAADILTAAFVDDPVITWLVPRELPHREKYIKGFMHSWTRFMIEHEGKAVLSSERDAVLVWEPSVRAVPLTDGDDLAFRADLTAATGPAAARCLQLIDLLDAHCPSDLPPHAHGALAAVLPGAKSRGAVMRLGIELLRYVYPRNWGIYCEASSESSSAVWQRLGGKAIGRQISLPGSDAVVTPLFIRREDIAAHPAVPLVMSALNEPN